MQFNAISLRCRCELEPNSLDVGDVYYCTTKALHLVLNNVGQVGSILWDFSVLLPAVKVSSCKVFPLRIEVDEHLCFAAPHLLPLITADHWPITAKSSLFATH